MKIFTWPFLILFFISLGCGIGGLFYVFWQVKFGNYDQLKKTTILSIFQEETSIFYNDDNTRIGSIFESQHRRYVPISEIPKPMIDALVAVEDKNFYRHFGIDPIAIGKAFVEGIKHRGKFRRGGSTITQQTVKNIVNDWEPSFSRKFREMIRAIQLERIYDKEQILEFYLNQFHVVGNGNGVDIAARYYFDKEVSELNLNEAAFIAGSVKGPGKYNPFIKYKLESKERAIRFANERKNYVLLQMFEQKLISEEVYKKTIQEPVPFNKGEFRTTEVALVNLIRSQLAKKEILDSLGITNPDDISIAGLKVFTTLDADLQRIAQLAVRRNLSRVEAILSGFSTEPQNKFRELRDIKKNSFIYGKVEGFSKHQSSPYPTIHLTFGKQIRGIIPPASLIRYAKNLSYVNGKGDDWNIKEMLQKIKKDDILFVEVKKDDKNKAILELQKRPQVSGGFIAVDKGEVRAIISGFDTLGYNRAVTAKRQPGSSFKSEVFFASLQLGWSLLDLLENDRQVFPFQGQFYIPRANHISKYASTSMIWTGVKSENIASVYLSAHLLDKLNFNQFKQLLQTMDLMPRPFESARDFHYRMAKSTGVSLNNEGISAFQLFNAVEELTPELIFSGDDQLLKKLKKFWWGTGYAEEIRQLIMDPKKSVSVKDRDIKIKLLANNFIRYKELLNLMQTDISRIISMSEFISIHDFLKDEHARSLLAKFRTIEEGGVRKYAYFSNTRQEDLLFDFDEQTYTTQGRLLEFSEIENFLENLRAYTENQTDLKNDIWLDGTLPSFVISRLNEIIPKNVREVKAKEKEDPYRLYSYYQHHDFRIGLALKYQVKFTHRMGVQSELEPILSYALGSNEVTASEVAKLYQTYLTGNAYRFYNEEPDNQISFIKRIEDRFGNILYEAKADVIEIFPHSTSQQMRQILKRVITHGTGRRALGELYVNVEDLNEETGERKLRKVRVPSYGKTGTNNDFKTSYFAGSMPYPTEKGEALDVENSYTVATYVGYDYNKVMENGYRRIYGSVGALPIWTDFMKEIIAVKKYADYVSPNFKTEWPTKVDDDIYPFYVELPTGLILKSGDEFEEWQSTDYAQTGEDYKNYFDELGTPNSSTLFLPKDPQQRIFSTF